MFLIFEPYLPGTSLWTEDEDPDQTALPRAVCSLPLVCYSDHFFTGKLDMNRTLVKSA